LVALLILRRLADRIDNNGVDSGLRRHKLQAELLSHVLQ
jgi:hypothetical protein